MNIKLNAQQIIFISFVSVIFCGSFLLNFGFSQNEKTDYVDSLFTATSATCVTGLTSVDISTNYNFFGQLIILILIQVGGLGFMTFSIFFTMIVRKKLSIKDKLILQESFIQYPVENFRQVLKNVVQSVFIIEFIGMLILFFRFKLHYHYKNALWLSIFHSVSAFCNAGLSLFTTNLINYNNDGWIVLTIGSLIVIGGIGFLVIYEFKNIMLSKKIYKNKINFSFHTKSVILVTFILIFVGTLLLFIFENSNPYLISKKWSEKFYIALFQAITPRTAGFNTIDLNYFTLPSIILIMILMFIGGSPGSTAGGIKTTTAFVLFNYLRCTLQGLPKIFVFKRTISFSVITQSVLILILAFLIVIAGIIMISISENSNIPLIKKLNSPFLSIIFEVISAFGTVGLSLGITPLLNSFSKIILILLMLIGRLGTLLAVLSIIEKETKINFEYPEDRILIG